MLRTKLYGACGQTALDKFDIEANLIDISRRKTAWALNCSKRGETRDSRQEIDVALIAIYLNLH